MEELRNQARELLTRQTVGVVIGYGEGSDGGVRPIFIQDPNRVNELIYDNRCKQNIAVYLYKPEVKNLGKMAIVAPPSVLKSIIQLAAEFQVAEGEVVILGVTPEGKYKDFPDFKAVEAYVAEVPDLSPEDLEKLKKLEAMSIDERWAYWQEQLSRCFKCYACRAACPLCYCTRCTVDCNQPQWIPVPSHDLGNLEWHIMRAMHLAGRCINCGACSNACPLDIPLNLLTQKLVQEVHHQFRARAGIAFKSDYSLSTFKPNDQENFIK